MRQIDDEGRIHLFAGVVLPLLEAKVSKISQTPTDEAEPILLWALKALVTLQSLNCNLMSRLLESRARYLTLIDSLSSACTSSPVSFHTEVGYAVYRCLGALAMAEVNYFSDAGGKVIIFYAHNGNYYVYKRLSDFRLLITCALCSLIMSTFTF